MGLSETVMNGILVVLALSIFAIVVNIKVKKAKVDKAPSNFLNIIEMFVEFINDMVKSNMGEKGMKFAPLMITLMSYLAVANIFGLIGLASPTSDYSITLTLALFVFALVQVVKFRSYGGLVGYGKSFTEPVPLLTPINIISEIANPISMSFRLFGNIMSGSLIMALLHGALGYFSPLVTAPLRLYFDIFTGLLQAYIFVMLTMIFIDGAVK
ncbi:F0F1 ATP synthase subunit A [Tissierella sp. Yu-01]|uniref:F0F1 ATP synthase subunit A n=1 Tax=Tissierella sp. Yu-01 TaxID=3035694 RepID=UPI00240D3F9D|nr:F0F1 ATP synthase subunit A [Tissierella sp. Yu-01]WFA08158.1 F0F1 ATP synthase subunit A [Tissierella sp. Yu-01]